MSEQLTKEYTADEAFLHQDPEEVAQARAVIARAEAEAEEANASWEEYKATRPKLDSIGRPRHPETSKPINADRYFEEQREAAWAAGQAPGENDQSSPYEGMTTGQIARKMAEAEHFGDKSTRAEAYKVLNDKLDALDDEIYQSHADELELLDDEAYEQWEDNNDLRDQKLWARLMTIHDRELARLKSHEDDQSAIQTQELLVEDETEEGQFQSGWMMLKKKFAKKRAGEVFKKAAEYVRKGGEKRKAATAVALGTLAMVGASFNALSDEVRGVPVTSGSMPPETELAKQTVGDTDDDLSASSAS